MTPTLSQSLDFSPYFRLLSVSEPHVFMGAVTEMVGLLIESSGPAADRKSVV